jgi:hypothetical protein
MHSRWMKSDPTYPPRFAEAQARVSQKLEDEAVRRAMHGVRRVLFYKGKPVRVHGEIVYEEEFSDTLMVVLLKANNPEKFKDRQTVTIDFKDWDGDVSKLSPAQVDAMFDIALKRVGMTEQELQKAIEAGQVVEVQPEPADEPKQ